MKQNAPKQNTMPIPPHIATAILGAAETRGLSSFYVYDTRVMAQKIRTLRTLLPANIALYYAMKANPHMAFLEAAKTGGVDGIEIASHGEAEIALKAGFAASSLIYTGPGKTPDELAWSVQHGVKTVHIESLTEAHRLNKIAGAHGKRQDILLRVNPNFHIHGAQVNFSGDSCKLGMDEGKLFEFLPEILALPNLRFLGLHVYAASGLLRVEDLLKNCELVFTMAQAIEKRFPATRCAIIDFGGGFGVDYQQTGQDFSPADYAAGLEKLIARFGFGDRKFVLELGRYLAADSGWYCTEIIDIKDSLGHKQVICAGGANHFRRPAALGFNHPLTILPRHQAKIFAGQMGVEREEVFIGGPLCNTADKLAAKDIYIERAEIGDIAVFNLAGAYGLTMSHFEFLSHGRPPEILI